MKDSLRVLMTGLIDYAGMFPPAKLPLAEAVMNYLSYRKSSDSWMLGRFVLPAERLKEVVHAELPVSVLGRGGPARSFVDGLNADLRLVEEAREASGGRLLVEMLETKIPQEFITSPEAIRPFLSGVCEMYERAGVKLFVEVPVGDERILEALAAIGTGPDTPGVKIRTGGLEASAFPSAEDVAATLWGCSADGLEFKATAGLHHALPRYDVGIKVQMHGYLNLFAAGILIHAGTITPRETLELLEEQSIENFSFDALGLSWRGRSATLEQVRDARSTFVRSFGSCSFDEPREEVQGFNGITRNR